MGPEGDNTLSENKPKVGFKLPKRISKFLHQIRRVLSAAVSVAETGLFATLLAAFTTLVGFYVTNVVEELRSGYTAVYSFSPDQKTNTVVFNIDNISRTKLIESANFVIKCADQSTKCFEPLPNRKPITYVSSVTTAPNYGRRIDTGTSGPAEINVCLGAIASSRTSVRIKPEQGSHAKLIALYDAWAKDCRANTEDARNILLLKPDNPHAFLTRRYFEIFAYTLIAFAVTLIFVAIVGLVRAIKQKLREG